jgi:hypothetical protein
MMDGYSWSKYLLEGATLVWPPDATPSDLSPHTVEITRTLGRINRDVITKRRFIARQAKNIAAIKHNLTIGKPKKSGEEGISTATGKEIDSIFKDEVRSAQLRGELPKELRIVPGNGRGPDIVLGVTAWELTTAEQARTKVPRDVDGQEMMYDFYFILPY